MLVSNPGLRPQQSGALAIKSSDGTKSNFAPKISKARNPPQKALLANTDRNNSILRNVAQLPHSCGALQECGGARQVGRADDGGAH